MEPGAKKFPPDRERQLGMEAVNSAELLMRRRLQIFCRFSRLRIVLNGDGVTAPVMYLRQQSPEFLPLQAIFERRWF